MKEKTYIWLEIFLIISLSFSVPYIFASYSGGLDAGIGSYIADDGKWENFEEKVLLFLFGDNFVSAQSSSASGLWTCPEDEFGSVCQEYIAEECNENCNTECFPGRRDDFFECRLGTCIDSDLGTCAPNSPRLACEDSGGNWDERAATEISECRPGCCLFSGQAQYVTENSCNYILDSSGAEGRFESVSNELECLALAETQSRGACLLEEVSGENGKRNCQFVEQSACLSSGGEFHEGVLCSNDELNTICERQESTSCFEGKDEVYWIDSCGNRENIYDSNRIRSYNDGHVLGKGESCSLASGNDEFGNQQSCGNCNYLLGSICGNPGEEDEESLHGDFVCRDLGCVDEWGNERQSGESWCSFEGQIGTEGEGNERRSVDVPGSRHYRSVCMDGEVRIDACGDFRREVCQESRDESIEFSSASCRVNQWQLCLDANTDEDKLGACEENGDCSLKPVRIDDFAFDVCTPKYPAGFDLRAENGGEVAESVCSIGSQTCTVVYQKKAFGGWKCEQNCDCLKPEFTETMNNLCMSLGDCGAHVNIIGDYSDEGVDGNTRLREIRPDYVSNLREYATAEEGQSADALSAEEIAAIFGLDVNDPEFDSKFADAIGKIGLGATGVVAATSLYIAAGSVGGIGAAISGAGGVFPAIQGGYDALIGRLSNVGATPHFSAFGNALAGAAAGAAVAFIVTSVFGANAETATAATIAGAISGTVFALNYGLFTTTWFLGTVLVVVLVVLIFSLLGWGDIKKREVVFSCLPWQAPSGGRGCESCGEDGFGCSRYQCESLGQTCEFVNAGTNEEACINVGADDNSAPIISPNEEAIGQEFRYAEVSANGFRVESNSGDGCIPAYERVDFGISLDERAQCKSDVIHTGSFDEMELFFGGSNLYEEDHEMSFILPSLESLGEYGFSPDERADFEMYVRCRDAAGNANAQEFGISFCVSPENDETAPLINQFIPESPAYAAFDATEREIEFYVNEPAECKWDVTDRNYESMTNFASCESDVESLTLQGWYCSAELPLSSDENDFYFRCEDQPWLEGLSEEELDGRQRNVNAESVVYEIVRSESALSIESVLPSGVLESAGLPKVVALEVETSGGAEGAARYCEFDFVGNGNYVRFFESGTNSHRQPNINLFREGSYDVPVRCEDEAGNTAEGTIDFELEVDDSGPIITRVYQQSGLTVVTNEAAQCAYSLESCNFAFEEGELMSGANLVHTTSFDSGQTYRVRCQDEFGNGGACLMIREGYFDG